MKRFATLFVALGLATSGSTVLAEQAKDQVSKQNAKPQPVQMTEAQMDNVTAGAALIDVSLSNVLNNNNVRVLVPVAAAIGVLNQGPVVATALGRQP